MLKKRTPKNSIKRQIEIAGQALAGLVEAGMLMACADGEIADEELDVVASVIDSFCDGKVTLREIRELMNTCLASLERDGFDDRVQAMASNLLTPELRELGLTCAAAVLCSDGEYVVGAEDEAYFDMADAMDVSKRRAESILSEVAAAYS
jgi:tellurite resistance protein